MSRGLHDLRESGSEPHGCQIVSTTGHLHECLDCRCSAATLRDRFRATATVSVHEGDALETDFAALTGGRRFRLVGNLPYNISTPLLFHVLRWSDLIEDMHFMLQKEVVDRIAATPGGKTWGRLSVMVRYRCAVTPLFDVPPEAFRPAPRITSSVVRLVPHDEPPVSIPDSAQFDRIVATAFAQRRKTLRNSLRGLIDADKIITATYPLEHVQAAFVAAMTGKSS